MTVVGVLFNLVCVQAGEIPSQKIGIYKKSVVLGIEKKQPKCEYEFVNQDKSPLAVSSVEDIIKKASHLTVNDSGAQPLHTYKYYSSEENMEIIAEVYTDQNYEKVENVKIIKGRNILIETNTGNLKNPKVDSRVIFEKYLVMNCK